MLGLLKKDLRLIRLQKVFFLLIFAMAVLFVSAWDNCLFSVSYCTMFCAFFTITTLSYDEMNHGLSFLFTLPVSRRGYVVEKYMIGFLLGVAGWLLSSLVTGIYIGVTGAVNFSSEWFAILLMILFAMCVFLCVVLPLQFKFGAEKGRMALIVLFLCVLGVAKIMDGAEVFRGFRMENLQWLANLSPGAVTAIAVVLLALLTVVSMSISIRVMERKQF